MAEVLFYHLDRQPLERVLPELLEKCLERGWRAVVQFGSEERCAAIDAHLWTYREDSFLPHGAEQGPHAARQPVLLTLEADAANGATVRFVVDGAGIPALDGVDRLVMMFDGHDQDQLESARMQWKTLKGEGHSLTYWQQTPDRRWEKKA